MADIDHQKAHFLIGTIRKIVGKPGERDYQQLTHAATHARETGIAALALADHVEKMFPFVTVDNIDRWMAADLASGGDPVTYWSRRSAAISSEGDIDAVPSIAETIITLRKRAESAEFAASHLHSLAHFFDKRSEWSLQTFGPGYRLVAVLAHIRKELSEIEAKPDDLEEWIDVVLLAMEGAWRSADASGIDFVEQLIEKMEKNRKRTWPDWRTLAPGQPSEHVRTIGEISTLPPPPPASDDTQRD